MNVHACMCACVHVCIRAYVHGTMHVEPSLSELSVPAIAYVHGVPLHACREHMHVHAHMHAHVHMHVS
jgi:hypothetical protein